MRAVMLEVPPHLLDERRRGLERLDDDHLRVKSAGAPRSSARREPPRPTT
jgi:hypothetical protein